MRQDQARLVPQVWLPGQPHEPDIRGFSGQEGWGRWTLGKEASLHFTLPAPQNVVINYTGYLGQMNQRVCVWLDERQIGHFEYNNGGGDKEFGQATAVELPAGPHTLTFRSNLSRRSTGAPVPSGADPRDLSIAFYRLDLLPRPGTRPTLTLPADLLRQPEVLRLGQFVFRTPGPYLPVSGQGLTLEFQWAGPGRPVLHFGLLRQREGQQFTFSLDGQPFYQTPRQPGAGLISGSTTLPAFPPGLHQLQIHGEGGGPARDTSYLLTEASVRPDQVSFYAQQLVLSPAANADFSRLWAAVGLLLLLLLLFQLLFGRRSLR